MSFAGPKDALVERGIAAKLTLLVVLAVLGQIALRNHSEDLTAVDDDCGVEQPVLGPQGRADRDHRVQRRAAGHDQLQRLKSGPKQCVLVKQVVV